MTDLPLTIFAYGSNMCTARLLQRTPSARVMGRARLDGHRLRFNKVGRDKSGKASIVPCDGESCVWGVLWQIHPLDKPDLDAAESLGTGYDEHIIQVRRDDDRLCDAVAYIARKEATDDAATPFAWYRDYIIAGAREHALTADYIASLEGVGTVDDPDPGRTRRNWRVAGIEP
jgi:AIG2-like family